MDIEFAILALLVDGPHSGYDLKKVFAESESLHWSGNNNQVYAALVALHKDGLVDREEQESASGPARKLYSLTDAGRARLREWLAAEVEPPHFRFSLLPRLMAADLLDDLELATLLTNYEQTLRIKILGLEELQRRGSGYQAGSDRQRFLWRQINDRALVAHRDELQWLMRLRNELAALQRKARTK